MPEAAASVLDHVHAPFEQRGGVYGTAQEDEMASTAAGGRARARGRR